VHDQFRKLGRLLSDFANARGGILAHLNIDVLEAIEDAWEDLCFDHDLCQVNGVLGNLG